MWAEYPKSCTTCTVIVAQVFYRLNSPKKIEMKHGQRSLSLMTFMNVRSLILFLSVSTIVPLTVLVITVLARAGYT